MFRLRRASAQHDPYGAPHRNAKGTEGTGNLWLAHGAPDIIPSEMKAKAPKEIVGKGGEIVLYTTKDGRAAVDVRLEQETIWLPQKDIAILFDTERSVITKHFRNIFASGELEEESNVQKMHIPGSDKPVAFYNLDAILSVGYRVNSRRGTEFRIWATSVLREHVLKGYTLNEKRLRDQVA